MDHSLCVVTLSYHASKQDLHSLCICSFLYHARNRSNSALASILLMCKQLSQSFSIGYFLLFQEFFTSFCPALLSLTLNSYNERNFYSLVHCLVLFIICFYIMESRKLIGQLLIGWSPLIFPQIGELSHLDLNSWLSLTSFLNPHYRWSLIPLFTSLPLP